MKQLYFLLVLIITLLSSICLSINYWGQKLHNDMAFPNDVATAVMYDVAMHKGATLKIVDNCEGQVESNTLNMMKVAGEK